MFEGNNKKFTIIRKSIACLFLLLFINISFSPFYKVIFEKIEVINLLNVSAEEENHAEHYKKLSELDKEYFDYASVYLGDYSLLNNKNSLYKENNHLKFHPEKDSPPPKDFYLLS